jgi:alpha-tubulin suppressor-like RCC1 family protein
MVDMSQRRFRIFIVGIASWMLVVPACSTEDTATPILMDIEPAIQLSSGLGHTCATLENGNLGCWGKANHGELGKSFGESSTAKPTPVPIVEKVLFAGAGTDGSCAVIEGNTVRCWGDGQDGQLGIDLACELGYGVCIFPPHPVSGLTDIVSVASKKGPLIAPDDAAPAHAACALDKAGLVRCWGASGAKELGRGTNPADPTNPEIVVDEQDFTLRDIVQISAGDARVCALDISGSVWCWGTISSYGQPGGAGAKRIDLPGAATAIAAGIGHACAVLADGRVACWGRNVNGECGVSTVQNSYCECSEGPGCPADCLLEPVIVRNVSNALGVAAGENHSCAWTKTGEAFCWGSNQTLQLGNSTRALESPAVAITTLSGRVIEMVAGREHSCALMQGGSVYCWGASGYGQAGL